MDTTTENISTKNTGTENIAGTETAHGRTVTNPTSAPTISAPSGRPPKTARRWAVPATLAAAVCLAGAGLVALDAFGSPAPAEPATPSVDQTELGTSQRLIQQSIDEALTTPSVNQTEFGTSQRLIEESIDQGRATQSSATQAAIEAQLRDAWARRAPGLAQQLLDPQADTAASDGVAVSAGRPDGVWQPTSAVQASDQTTSCDFARYC